MFTGLVEGKGRIIKAESRPDGIRRVTIASAFDLGRLTLGASIAVNGVCLTVVAKRGRQFSADLGPETLAITKFAACAVGDTVHLERPLRVGDPLGGHLVAGHVDGVGTVAKTRKVGGALELIVKVPATIGAYLAAKGSVTIDGVSLTVNRCSGNRFSVMLIPHTLKITALGERVAGDHVNIETDWIAKHVITTVERLFPTRRRRDKSRKK
jgi:riboflavin synthase